LSKNLLLIVEKPLSIKKLIFQGGEINE